MWVLVQQFPRKCNFSFRLGFYSSNYYYSSSVTPLNFVLKYNKINQVALLTI